MDIKLTPNVPTTEVSEPFLQGMVDRMAVSFCKYGAVAEAYPHKVDAIECVRMRLRKYERTGNTEYLMDAANFAMIEFMRPRLPGAHYAPTDSKGSPGRKWHGEVDPTQAPNVPARSDA
jgi:hypothetical protein